EAVERRVAIGHGDSTIHTVEHLLAGVAAHEIDDVTVELSGPEPPILDGSVQPYFQALAEARPVEVGGDAVILAVPAPFTVTEGECSYVVAPAKELRLTVTIGGPPPHRASGRELRGDGGGLRARARPGTDLRLHQGDRRSPREGTDQGRVRGQRDRARRAGDRERRQAPLARRVRAPQSGRHRRGSGAHGRSYPGPRDRDPPEPQGQRGAGGSHR